MKRFLFLLALIASTGWNAAAWAQKPKIKEMTFRVDGKTVTCVTGEVRVSVTLIFDVAMRDTIPIIKFGLAAPYSTPVPFITKDWLDDKKTFVASFDINDTVPPTADGLYEFFIRKAYAVSGDTLTPVLSDALKNGANQPATLYISRTGKLMANTGKIDFGAIPAGTTREKTLVIKNITCADVALARFTVANPFTIINAPTGEKISPDDSLTLVLRFNSSTRKSYAGNIKINYTSNQQSDSIEVQLAGVTRGPEMVVVPEQPPPPPVDFGAIVTGDSASRTILFTNKKATQITLSDTLRIFSVVLNPSAGYSVLPDTLVVAPGDTKSVTITFKPTAATAYNSSLTFSTNDSAKAGGKISLAVSGTGQVKTPPPEVPTNFTVNWPAGRAGYINASFFNICLPLSQDEAGRISQVRWKFSLEPNKPPTTAGDTTSGLFGGSSVLTRVDSCGYGFSIPLASKLTGYPSVRLYYYIWFEGVNGTSSYNDPALRYSAELYYDVIAPAFTTAPNAALGTTYGWAGGHAFYTNGDSLRLCWQSNDSSGISEVRWKFSTAANLPASANDTTGGGSLRRDGLACVTVPLIGRAQGRWYLYVWLIDRSGNSNHQAASRLYFAYDVTAPGAPVAPFTRRISREDWFNTKRNPFTLAFNIIDTLRDAARVRWKFKVKPAGQAATFDGESPFMHNGGQWSFQIYFNSTVPCGEDSLYFWLADSAGNVNALNYAVTGYKFDMCSPVITRLRSGDAIANKRTAFSDTVRIFDHTKVIWDSVLYRFGGARANQPPRRLRRVTNSKDLFVVEIPPDGVTTRGLEYQVFAQDSLKNPYGIGPKSQISSSVCGETDNANWQAVRVRTGVDGEFRIDKDGNPVAQPSGRDQSNYTLFSVPFELDETEPKDVLEDDLGPYDRTKWRFFEYRPEMGANGWIEYNNTVPTISPFRPGRAFFMLVADAGKVIDSGSGKTLTTARPDTLTLQDGWNLFGNPFNFPISKYKIRLINASIPKDSLSILTYERQWNYDNTIEPWKGYAIYVKRQLSEQPVKMIICPIATVSRIGKDSPVAVTSADDWTIQISAKAGAAIDTINWVGARSTAAEEYDDFDLVEPPVIGEYVSVYVPNLSWSLHPMKYTADFRPIRQEVYEWPLQVNSNSSAGEVNLEFKGLANLPNGYEAYLVDPAYGLARNLKHNPVYRFLASSTGIDKSLKLLVGKPEALKKHSSAVALVPQAFELAQNFPNPFAAKTAQALTAIRYTLPKSATVTVEVYNMLGQKVRTLVDHQLQEADYYLATWNGRDEVGKEVSSGIYLYRILAESGSERFAATKKLLLVK